MPGRRLWTDYTYLVSNDRLNMIKLMDIKIIPGGGGGLLQGAVSVFV
jgi:hypothetical protein